MLSDSASIESEVENVEETVSFAVNVLGDESAARICNSLSQANNQCYTREVIPTFSSSCTPNLPVRKRKSPGAMLSSLDDNLLNPTEAKRPNNNNNNNNSNNNNDNNNNNTTFTEATYSNPNVNSLQIFSESHILMSALPPIIRPPMPKAREIRLEQNRKAARESRRRKKVMIEELQRSVIFFSRANATLKQQNDELQGILFQTQAAIQRVNASDAVVPPNTAVEVQAPTTFVPEPSQVMNVPQKVEAQSEPSTEYVTPKDYTQTIPSTLTVSNIQANNMTNNSSNDALNVTSNDTAAAAALLAAASSTGTSSATPQSFMPFFQAMAMAPASAMLPAPVNHAYAMQQQLAAAHFFAAAANPVVFQQQQVVMQQLQQQAAAAWQNATAKSAQNSPPVTPDISFATNRCLPLTGNTKQS
uniref:BZIP domain-containing protein n=1 Tax=Eucampia antarctica TaxID=49252 RepID=A0A7S2R1A2_9STRA